MKLSTIYLDDQATTPVDPEVLLAMKPYFCEAFGNPSSSTHPFGWQASWAVQKSRETVAHFLGADPSHVIFTSGATESNNLALMGVMNSFSGPKHLIVGATEHKAILEVAGYLETRGVEVTIIKPNSFGLIEVDSVAAALKPHTRLISVMWANNEIGTCNPIREIGLLAQAHGVLFHTDAAQAASRNRIDVQEMGIDLMSISAHKMYGPKGVGALFVDRSRVSLQPIMFGGSQEFGLRPGTHNVPGIVGLARACELAVSLRETESRRLASWRDELLQFFKEHWPKTFLHGHPTLRLCSNLSVAFEGYPVAKLMEGLGGLAMSTTSACQSQCVKMSHVLEAIGCSPERASFTLRIGLGRFTRASDVEALKKRFLQRRSVGVMEGQPLSCAPFQDHGL